MARPPLGSTIEIDKEKYPSCSGTVASIIERKDGGYDLIVILDYITPLRYVRIPGEEWERFIEDWLRECYDEIACTPEGDNS